jgi:hypothetical protein
MGSDRLAADHWRIGILHNSSAVLQETATKLDWCSTGPASWMLGFSSLFSCLHTSQQHESLQDLD